MDLPAPIQLYAPVPPRSETIVGNEVATVTQVEDIETGIGYLSSPTVESSAARKTNRYSASTNAQV